jgi:hypothetical protein
VVVQQAPVQQPVVVQQSDNSGAVIAAGLAGAAIGAMAANSGGRDYDDRYAPSRQTNAQQVQQVNVTHVTKNVTINNGHPNEVPPAPLKPDGTPNAPIAPAAKAPTYAVAGSVPNPVPTVKSMPTALPVTQSKLIGYSSAVPSTPALPAPAPKPAPVNLAKYNMPAPKPTYGSTSSYKPVSVSYKPSSSGSSKK